MSQAEELLNSITTYTTDPATEEHIVIGNNRFIEVPESLRRIAVQFDHNVETVTFDCPRYWDEHDLSTMYIYINYLRKDNVKGKYIAKNVRVDETDENIIHFEWTIGNEVSLVKGAVTFLVCAIRTDEEGIEEVHWNSELNTQMIVSDGLETDEEVFNQHPDIITDLLTRMDALKDSDGILDTSLSQEGFAADAGAVGVALGEIDNRINSNDTDIENININLENTNKRIDDNDTDIEKINANLETANKRIDDNDTDIENINESISNMFTKSDILDQLYFFTKYHILDGITIQDYTTPVLTNDNRQEHICSWKYKANSNNAPENAYEMFGNRTSAIKSFALNNEDSYLELYISTPYYIKLEKITNYKDPGLNDYFNIEVSGSNDNINFESIYTKTAVQFKSNYNVNNNGTFGEIEITTDKMYKYFKIKFTNSNDPIIRNRIVLIGDSFSEMDLTEETEEKLYENCKTGQVVHVETSENYLMYDNFDYRIKINDVQTIPLPTDMAAGKRYRLVYNGTGFEHEQI